MELTDLTLEAKIDLLWELLETAYPTKNPEGYSNSPVSLEQLYTSTTVLINTGKEYQQVGNYAPEEAEELMFTKQLCQAFGFSPRLI